MPLRIITLCSLYFRRFRKIATSDYQLRHVRPFVRMQQLGSHWTDFRENSYLGIFRKSIEKIQVLLKSDNQRVLYMKTSIHLLYLDELFVEWESFLREVLEKKISVTKVWCSPVMGKLRPAGQIRPPEMFYPARATLFLI